VSAKPKRWEAIIVRMSMVTSLLTS
jgi:hypothetical protein